MAKYNVYTDGNGSDAIMVQGLGHYVPVDRWAEIAQERDALVAKLALIDQAWQNAGRWPDTADEVARIGILIQCDPVICLREVQAVAGRAGFIAGCELIIDFVSDGSNTGAYKFHADEYAAKARQGGAR